MTDSQATRRVHPAILARARELRREMTPQERKLWQRLRRKQLYGLRFRRQHPIHRFIVDFFCHERMLAVEIDGHGHAEPEQQAYDQARTEWLTQRGFRVIRFTNREVDTNIEGVLQEIARVCGVEDLPPSSSPQGGEDLAFPQRGEDLAAPQREEDLASPQRGEDLASPQREEDLASPQRGEDLPPSSSPQRGEDLASPPAGGD